MSTSPLPIARMESAAASPAMMPAAAAPPSPANGRRSLGNDLLDILLQGGLPRGSIYLLIGPAYSGKEMVAANFARAAVRAREPVVVVLTGATPARFRERSAWLGPDFPAHEQHGGVAYVDCYASVLGRGDRDPLTVAQPAADAADAVVDALVQARVRVGESPRLIVDSVSDLLLHAPGQDAPGRWLHRLTGVARALGYTTLLTADSGVHAPTELALLRHRCDGAIEFREADDGRTFLRARGAAGGMTRDWVEYVLGAELDIVGSFSENKIR